MLVLLNVGQLYLVEVVLSNILSLFVGLVSGLLLIVVDLGLLFDVGCCLLLVVVASF